MSGILLEMLSIMVLARILAGVCALFLGRQLFWLFVGVVGFACGSELAIRLYRGAPELLVLALALATGVLGAMVAHALQELMIGVVGFIIGSYVGGQILIAVLPYPGRYIWFALLSGGLAGMVLFLGLFDWAVIILSSVFGAGLIVQAVSPDPRVTPFVLVTLVAVGVAVQAAVMHRRSPLTH